MASFFMQDLRVQRGFSRAEISRRARMSASDVGKIEAGRLKPYPSQLARIARALGFDGDPAELMSQGVEDDRR